MKSKPLRDCYVGKDRDDFEAGYFQEWMFGDPIKSTYIPLADEVLANPKAFRYSVEDFDRARKNSSHSVAYCHGYACARLLLSQVEA